MDQRGGRAHASQYMQPLCMTALQYRRTLLDLKYELLMQRMCRKESPDTAFNMPNEHSSPSPTNFLANPSSRASAKTKFGHIDPFVWDQWADSNRCSGYNGGVLNRTSFNEANCRSQLDQFEKRSSGCFEQRPTAKAGRDETDDTLREIHLQDSCKEIVRGSEERSTQTKTFCSKAIGTKDNEFPKEPYTDCDSEHPLCGPRFYGADTNLETGKVACLLCGQVIPVGDHLDSDLCLDTSSVASSDEDQGHIFRTPRRFDKRSMSTIGEENSLAGEDSRSAGTWKIEPKGNSNDDQYAKSIKREQMVEDTCKLLCTLRDRVLAMQEALDTFVAESQAEDKNDDEY